MTSSHAKHATTLAGLSLIAVAVLAFAGPVRAFDSESNGSDGALNLTNPNPDQPMTIEFDPKTFNPPLDPDGDNVYHFTTITIGPGVTVHLTANNLNGPVYWLAQGDVQIDGTIDLNGEDGQDGINLPGSQLPAAPGAGGFRGGSGGTLGHAASPAQPGGGPGGGTAVRRGGGGAGYGGPGSAAGSLDGCPLEWDGESGSDGGPAYGTLALVPLTGGSGGGGGQPRGTTNGGSGGAGGGALLIASSTAVTVNGSITANGGHGGDSTGFAGGGGGGGAIRLAARDVGGSGSLSAQGGGKGNGPVWNPGCPGMGTADSGNGGVGGFGYIRIEAFTNNFTGTSNPVPTLAFPVRAFLDAHPTLVVKSIDGKPVANPTASLITPDVVTETNLPVTVEIEARNVPVGTVVQLYLGSDNAADNVLDSTPLAGTQALSTAAVTIDQLPSGFSRGFLRAKWGQ